MISTHFLVPEYTLEIRTALQSGGVVPPTILVPGQMCVVAVRRVLQRLRVFRTVWSSNKINPGRETFIHVYVFDSMEIHILFYFVSIKKNKKKRRRSVCRQPARLCVEVYTS